VVWEKEYKWLITVYLGGPHVYDVTNYLQDHPGGPEIMMEYAGSFV